VLSVFQFLKSVKREKRAKIVKNEVFELEMISIWAKKWTPWGCSIFEHNDQVLN
jgi:hypothetical protein